MRALSLAWLLISFTHHGLLSSFSTHKIGSMLALEVLAAALENYLGISWCCDVFGLVTSVT